jgi:type I restriction enzyme S subunit
LLRAKREELPLDRAPLLAEGEILVVRSGAYTGDSALISEAWAGSAPGYDLRVTPATADSRFLSWCLLSDFALDHMTLASSRAAQPHLNAEELGELPIPLCPLEEQRRIADFLDAETVRIDKMVHARAKQAELMAERIDATRERIFGPEVAGAYDVPLMYLTDAYRPIVYGIVQAGPEIPNGVPYIKTGDIKGLRPERLSRTSPEIHHQYRRAAVHPGDIVIAMRASIGAVTVVPEDLPEANLTQGTARIAAAKNVDPTWLFQALQSRRVHEQCDNRAVGTTFRTLNIWDLRRLLIPAVDLLQQKKAVSQFQGVEASYKRYANAVELQLSTLAERRQALITAAVTGEFDVSAASGRGIEE